MTFLIKANGLELTDQIKDYARQKITSLEKYYSQIIKAEVEVGRDTNKHQKGEIFFCEVNLDVPGKIIRVKKTEKRLFKAIDKTKDHLKIMLKRHKEKELEAQRRSARKDKIA